MTKTILISISDGMVERNLLKTDFFALLQKHGHTIHIVSSHKPYYDYLVKTYQSANLAIHYRPYDISKWDALFAILLRQSIHTHTVSEIQLSQWKGIYGREKISFPVYLIFRCLWFLGQFKPWRTLLRFLYRQLCPTKYCADLIGSIKPNLIFVPSISPSDYKLVQQASQLGIACVQMIKSWDNLTTKTFLGILPNWLVTHNEVMKTEAVTISDMPAERVFVSGIPQFDYITQHKETLLESRDKFYSSLAIDTHKQVILFSASGDIVSPYDRDYLFMIDKAIEEGSLPPKTHVQVRAHPKFASNFDGVEKLKHVTLDKPFTYLTEASRDWVFAKKDVAHWYNSLYHAAVIINVASTMAIDAAVVDRPAICLDFDGYQSVPELESIHRYYLREHYRKVIETGAVPLVASEQELIDALNKAMKYPEKTAESRKRLVAEQCYKLDGQSSVRLVNFIVSKL